MSTTPTGKIRMFLAVNVPVPTVRRLMDEVRAVQPMVATAGLEVAWVPAANVHLTMKFLGAARPEIVEAMTGRLGQALAARTPFDVEVRGLGAFPSAVRPHILWAGVKASLPLVALQQDLEQVMDGLGFPREERAFSPHLTLGRVKSGEGSLEAAFAGREAASFGGGRVAEVVIYESRTLRAGAEYVALARVAIGGERREVVMPTYKDDGGSNDSAGD